jgi:outer membrane protein assembly factor BamA
MGGAYGDNSYVSLPDRYYGLRGYPTSGMRGNHIWLASAEYRMPLAHIERGLWTAPIWLRSIALTIFVEAGQTFDTEDYRDFQGSEEGFRTFWENTRPAVGVELVGDVVLGWGAYFQGRVGYALGMGSGALPGGTFYAQLGSSF